MNRLPRRDLLSRPVVYDYGAPHEFFLDLMEHYKKTSKFSVRQQTRKLKGCSPALVSQVLSGRRRLTRDQLPSFARLFKLHAFELEFIDQSLKGEAVPTVPSEGRRERRTQNHILSSWLNLYVKDLVNLHGFAPEADVLHKMLFGIASPQRIERATAFLMKEGFWRRTSDKKIMAEDPALISTNEIPNEKIRELHKQALKIALRGIDVFPVERRKASTVLMSVHRDKLPELRGLIDSFQNQLLKFIEDHPEGKDDLVQITVHLTPVGERLS